MCSLINPKDLGFERERRFTWPRLYGSTLGWIPRKRWRRLPDQFPSPCEAYSESLQRPGARPTIVIPHCWAHQNRPPWGRHSKTGHWQDDRRIFRTLDLQARGGGAEGPPPQGRRGATAEKVLRLAARFGARIAWTVFTIILELCKNRSGMGCIVYTCWYYMLACRHVSPLIIGYCRLCVGAIPQVDYGIYTTYTIWHHNISCIQGRIQDFWKGGGAS